MYGSYTWSDAKPADVLSESCQNNVSVLSIIPLQLTIQSFTPPFIHSFTLAGNYNNLTTILSQIDQMATKKCLASLKFAPTNFSSCKSPVSDDLDKIYNVCIPYRMIKSRCLFALKWRLSAYFRPCTHSAGKSFF